MPVLTVLLDKEQRQIPFAGTPTVREILTGVSDLSGMQAHPCGGRGVCGQCGIRISGQISEPTQAEQSFGRRLSCQTRLMGDAVLLLSDAPAMRILTGNADRENGSSTQDGALRDFRSEGRLTAAADLGTTTVALSLYKEGADTPLYSAGTVNPQRAVSDDVIGRIHFAMTEGAEPLREGIRDALRGLIRDAGAEGKISRWIITGNTTMLYLFTGRNPRSLGQAPFAPDGHFDETVLFDGVPAYLPPCVHGFLGADLLCAVLSSGIHRQKAPALLCDIGTNGEIALWKDGKLYAASVAMGPALEGVGIHQGCGAIPGAIDRVAPTGGGMIAGTIGGGPAVGICGSGVLDAIACGLLLGRIDPEGRLTGEMMLRDGIGLDQEDVQAVLLARGAFGAGLERLLDISHTAPEEIQCAYLCGGFGSRLNLVSAGQIGLWPKKWIARTEILGNAALCGAAMLREEDGRKEIRSLAARTEPVLFGGEAAFQAAFLRHLRFCSV